MCCTRRECGVCTTPTGVVGKSTRAVLPSMVCSIISLPTTPMGVVGKSVHDMLSTYNYSIQPLRVINTSLVIYIVEMI